MKMTGLLLKTAGCFLVYAAALTLAAPRECVYKNKALVIAMLALHHGENCDIALQRGAQQVAALQLATDRVNAAANLPNLEIRVMDTCSKTDEAVKVALRALVQAQQGCQGPMFLGFLGPDDHDSLRAVSKVVSVFLYPHVVPSAVRSFSQFNTLSIQVADPSVAAKGIRMMLNEMNWSSFYFAFTSHPVTSEIAASLVEAEELCILQTVLQIPSANNPNNDFVAYNILLRALQQAESSRLLLLADTAESAEGLMNHLQAVATKTKFVIYVLGSGLLPWRMTSELAANTVILHETSKATALPESFQAYVETSTLWSEYTNQSQCEESCKGPFIPDPSTTNLVYSVHLFHEAMRSGLALKCRPGTGICSKFANSPKEEWQTIVEATSVFVKDGEGSRKIRFHMFIPSYIAVLATKDDGIFEEVGMISDGEQVFLKRRESLPTVESDYHEQCEEKLMILTTKRSTTPPATPTPTTGMSLDVDIFGMDVKLSELGYYELVAMLTSLVFGMVVIVLILICVVYRCFRIKVENTFSSPSSTSDDTPDRKKERNIADRRRFFKSSTRSIHTVQE